MGRIRVLPDNIANKIAAGEVVERPASVVKELLENSLDAGASRLRVEAVAGGRRLIRISDDGCGMSQDDALLAFERHATSKLRDVADLFSIRTLGFRGEALPSIASVSRLTLETRAADEQIGTRIEIAGGRMLQVQETALPPGTTIAVKDLFYNVPVRRKFLRTEKTELAHVAALVTHYSLAHLDKSFHLSNENGPLLNVTPVTELGDRVYQVFGSAVLDDLVELRPIERELEVGPSPAPGPFTDPADAAERRAVRQSFRLRGYVSRAHIQKLNRNSIYVFVNNRLIRDRVVLKAISNAYHNVIPPGSFPFALLFLDIPYDEVDVNVHPSKTEVRFRHQSFIHDFVRDALRQRLFESKPVSALPLPASPAQPAAGLPYSEASQRLDRESPAPDEPGEVAPELRLRSEAPPSGRLDFGAAPAMNFGAPPPADFGAPPAAGPAPSEAAAPSPIFDPAGLPPIDPRPHSRAPLVDRPGEGLESLASLDRLRPLGQIRDSFIVAAGPDGLWIIDQHVAHERILFEQVVARRRQGRPEVQRLLMPIILTLQPGQDLVFDRLNEELERNGFEIEPFGSRTIAVKAAPAALSPPEIESLLHEILETPERELRSVSLDSLQSQIAATIACHAAIKVNMPLDPAKMRWLLDELAKTECPMACPHGRPIALRYGLKDILKAFHRI
ncbi:MAG: DNA mismatch repair endonuclease MutL [Acidobacteria bacterium]|nr:DNA mismatch repair endonuclease MutL [Acidobacteriota bacterium]